MSARAQTGPEILTFGCRLNLVESEIIRRLAHAAALDDAVIVHTCAVTASAEREARQAVRRARRRRPGARIVVTGCAAQIAPERFEAMPEVSNVLGNAEKLDFGAWLGLADNPNAPRRAVADVARARHTAWHLVDGFDAQTRAFVQVQQGCDHRCTFCIIPLARGPSRSVPLGALVQQLRTLVAKGFREVVLTGVDLTSYGANLPGRPTLGAAIRRLLAAVPDLPRLRLSSLDPAELGDDFWRAFADEERLMPHLHLSVQSGDDLILKRMKRRHTADQVRAVVARARALRPETAFGADIIAGFPTETDAQAGNSLRLVEAAGIVYLHVFPFSSRTGTPASRMPQVASATIRARAAALRAAGQSQRRAHLQRQIGRRVEALIERDGRRGHTRDFAPIVLDHDAVPGALVRADVIGAERETLLGRAIDPD
ncbi:MAG TPA: tRNA (N(6)-L-threonylcarbamoyladenosine(37)-C(2))-methylthiotransferase MtaB [Alphaproteobacteria bacterium]|nr:tRNA (N(6)-L-threonylcarbamoyladenosine(37)-C(2))-methylthiotransferase MtaB [Alphaproteobacteria bacterium]